MSYNYVSFIGETFLLVGMSFGKWDEMKDRMDIHYEWKSKAGGARNGKAGKPKIGGVFG